MTNYNERLDQILSEQLHKMSYDIEAYGITDCKNYLPDYKQAITSLIKELVAEAKPEQQKIENMGDTFKVEWARGYNVATDRFEQNLLKALEEI